MAEPVGIVLPEMIVIEPDFAAVDVDERNFFASAVSSKFPFQPPLRYSEPSAVAVVLKMKSSVLDYEILYNYLENPDKLASYSLIDCLINANKLLLDLMSMQFDCRAMIFEISIFPAAAAADV